MIPAKPLAICAVFKNEAPFLLEWLAYHRAIGFDRFFLYDNDSTDGAADLIRSSALAPCVTLRHWPRRPSQLPAYRHFIYNHGADCAWVAFIDLDEFLLPLHHDSIRPLLRRFAGFSAALVHWRVYGPSGHEEPPQGLCIENYTWRAEDSLPVNRHIKTLARCEDLLDVTHNPHEFQLKGPVCDTTGQEVPLNGLRDQACHQNLVLNHYVTRSRHDWLAKISRGSAMFEYKEPKYRQDLFDHYAQVSTVQDTAIARFAPQVRSLLARRPSRTPPAAAPASPFTVQAHIQNVGDVDGQCGDWIGTRGGGRHIEGFALQVPPEIHYMAALGPHGTTAWTQPGTYCGTRGLRVPMTGFAIRTPDSSPYECLYEASFTDGSTSPPTGNGRLCSGRSPVEAMRIVLRPR